MFKKMSGFERAWVRSLICMYLTCILLSVVIGNFTAAFMVSFIAIIEGIAMVQSYRRIYGPVWEKDEQYGDECE